MENQKKQIKTIGMSFIGKFFGWATGIILILLGFVILYRGFASGLIGKLFLSSILFILSGFILLPVFNLILIKIFKIQFSKWIRFFIFIFLIIFGFILISMALVPNMEDDMENYEPGVFINESSPEAIKQINVSIGEVSLNGGILSFDVVTENKGNVQVSFQVIRLIFVDSEDEEVYSVDATADSVMDLYPGEIATSKMDVENWSEETGDYTVSASVLDLEGNILASAERQFSV